jgi:magnesium transporter
VTLEEHAEADAPHGIINCASYVDGCRAADLSIDQIPAALSDPGAFVWLGLYEPSEELLGQVQRAFGLHDLAVEDAHRAHQRPKLERYGDSLFVVLRTARLATGSRLDFGETHIFVGKRYVVTVRHGSLKSHVGLRARCEKQPRRLARGPGYVLYALMDFVVDQYFPLITELEDQFESIEADIFDDEFDRETTARIYHLRRDLMLLKRAATPLIEVCHRLERFEDDLVPEEGRVYFRDVHDHLLRIQELIDGLREMVGSALDAHLSLRSISQNEETKRLAAWAAIIAVPTMVAGIYGMNFESMPELSWVFGYPLTIGFMVAACLWLYRRFKRIGWL